MRFGPVPLDQAQGAILAHSVDVGAKRLRKGIHLAPEDIAAMQDAGLNRVVVAQLAPDEIDENTAAARLAQGLAAPQDHGLRITDAFTGRVNAIARTAGVVLVDAERIHAFNRVNPMITIATVPKFHLADAGSMVATIKIIAFGVPAADVARAARCLTGAIRLHPPVLRRASLIVTRFRDEDSDKAIKAIQTRLQRWNVTLADVQTVRHHEDHIAAALRRVRSDLALILTASATSDIRDVAPLALTMAKGRVERFGMPVDPGNLLFIGDLDGLPVIGLPGCARSPALNGADWVLARVICGVHVADADIAAMGVGGLLKEIPTRPQPRNRTPRQSGSP